MRVVVRLTPSYRFINEFELSQEPETNRAKNLTPKGNQNMGIADEYISPISFQHKEIQGN